MVGILAVQVGLGFLVEISAEGASLGDVVVTAHGSEHAVAQHRLEEEARSRQGVFEGVVVKRLHADFREVSDLAGDIRVSVQDVGAGCAGQVLQAFLAVHHVLHTGNPVVSLHVSDLAALAVNPFNAFADLEGVLQAVFAHRHLGGQGGLVHVLVVILEQSVIGVHDGAGVRLLGGVQHVPCGGIAGVGVVVFIGQLVALAGQVFLGFGFPGAGAAGLVPQGAEFLDFGALQDAFLDDDRLVHPVLVVAPQGGGGGTGSDAGHGVLAATAVQGDHNGRFKQLRFGDSHLGVALGNRRGFLGLGIELIILAKNILVDLGRLFFIGFNVYFGLRFSRKLLQPCSFFFGSLGFLSSALVLFDSRELVLDRFDLAVQIFDLLVQLGLDRGLLPVHHESEHERGHCDQCKHNGQDTGFVLHVASPFRFCREFPALMVTNCYDNSILLIIVQYFFSRPGRFANVCAL